MAPNNPNDSEFDRPSGNRRGQKSERNFDTGGHIDVYQATNNASLHGDHDTTLSRSQPRSRQPALNVGETSPATPSTPSNIRASASTIETPGYLRTGPARNEGNPDYQHNTDSHTFSQYAAQPYSNQPIPLGNPTSAFLGNNQYQTGSYQQDPQYLSHIPFMTGYGSVTTQPAYPAHGIPNQPYEITIPTPAVTPPTIANPNLKIGEVHRTNNPGYKYVCDRCSQPFTRAQDLDRHYNGAHDPEPTVYWCHIGGYPRCQRPFDRHDKMCDHVRAAHQNCV